MGWSLEVEKVGPRGKVLGKLMGNVNSSGENWIDIALPIESGKDWETLRFSQSTGKCETNKEYRLSLKEVNYLNDPKNWEIKKYKKTNDKKDSEDI